MLSISFGILSVAGWFGETVPSSLVQPTSKRMIIGRYMLKKRFISSFRYRFTHLRILAFTHSRIYTLSAKPTAHHTHSYIGSTWSQTSVYEFSNSHISTFHLCLIHHVAARTTLFAFLFPCAAALPSANIVCILSQISARCLSVWSIERCRHPSLNTAQCRL